MILLRHALLPFCLLLFSSYSAAAFDLVKRSWCHFQAPNLDLISDLPPDQAEALLARLVRFDQAASALLGQGDAASRPRLKVLVFAKRRDFERVFDSPNFAGFMSGSIHENLLAVGPDDSGEYLVGNLMHEYVHHMLRNDPSGAWPLWYEEGLASFLATLTVNERGVVVGATTKHQPERLHQRGSWDEHEVRYLDAPTSLPDGDTVWLRDLLLTGSSLDRRGSAIHDFYQRSWLLVHLVRHGHLAGFPDRRRVLDAYLQALRGGGDPVQSFANTLDENLVELARDFGRYRHRGRFPIQEIVLSLPAPSPVVTVGCLESGEVAYQLGMASSMINPGFARDAFDWLVERSSDDPRPYVGYSVLERAEGEFLEAWRAARFAVRLDDANARARVEMATAMVEACRESDNPECRAQWQRAVEVYQAALVLEPARTDAQFGLGVVHFLLGESELAIAALEHAHTQAPWAPRISLFLGEAYRLAGQPQRAGWHLLRAMRWEVEPEWRDKAREAVRLLDATNG